MLTTISTYQTVTEYEEDIYNMKHIRHVRTYMASTTTEMLVKVS